MDEQPPAEPANEQPRRVQKSGPGRLFWRPTQPHPLDILPEDVEGLDALVPACVEQLTTQAATLQRLLSDLVAQDLKVSLHTRDEQALIAIHQRFGMRKHLEHFQHYFAWLRRQHFLGLIRVITATLALATQLLQETSRLLQVPNTNASPLTETPLPEPPMDRAEQRLRGIHHEQPMTFVGDMGQSRRLLRQFEEQLPTLRRQLALGKGWFEIYSLPKLHRKQILIDYLNALDAWEIAHRPIPDEVAGAIPAGVIASITQGRPLKKLPKDLRDQVFDTTWVGPYARFRWQEGEHTYTISLGLIDDYPPMPFMPEGE